MRVLTLNRALLLAMLLGAGNLFGFAPFSLHWLPIVTLAGWFALQLQFPEPHQALKLGFAFGFAGFAAGIGWLFISLNHYGGMPALLAILAVALFAAYLALFPALAAWAAARVGGLPRLLILPACFGLAEWLRGWLFSGFPWLSPGYSQVPDGWLAGYAPLLGVYGLTYLLAVCAALLLLLLRREASGQVRLMAAVGLALLLLGGLGLRQVAWTRPVGMPVTVALLQGNIPQDRKWQESELADTFERYRRLVIAARQQLIVLPETALPIFLHDIPGEYLDALRAHARSVGADVLLGVPALTDNGQQYYNTVTSIGVSAAQMYRKIHLVPFGEFIPFKRLLGGVYQSLSIPLTDFAEGSASQGAMQVAGQKLLVNICYEDVFGEELIRRVPAATLMLNVTNDAWYDRSPAAQQHLQISQMRALETGRYMLRATNTGMTAIIDERGRLQRLAPWFERLALTGQAQGFQGETPYVRFGNLPVVVWMSLLLVAGLVRRQRHKA